MAVYHQVDDEILIRSPNGSVLCYTTGSRYRSVSVAGLITDAGVEGNIRRRLIDDQLDGSPRLMSLSESQLVERRPRSANAYEGLLRGTAPVVTELPPVEVIDEVAIPVVKPPRSMPRQLKLQGVSSRSAWEGRLCPRRYDPSQCEKGRRRRRSPSSSSSSERYSDHHSPLAMPLNHGLDHARGSDRGVPDRTPRGDSRERSRESRVRERRWRGVRRWVTARDQETPGERRRAVVVR